MDSVLIYSIVPEFKGVSEGAKDLITKLLVKPDKRLKACDVLKHPWMN